jgi:hypothetical protein
MINDHIYWVTKARNNSTHEAREGAIQIKRLKNCLPKHERAGGYILQKCNYRFGKLYSSSYRTVADDNSTSRLCSPANTVELRRRPEQFRRSITWVEFYIQDWAGTLSFALGYRKKDSTSGLYVLGRPTKPLRTLLHPLPFTLLVSSADLVVGRTRCLRFGLPRSHTFLCCWHF